jgi:hypothetical protein
VNICHTSVHNNNKRSLLAINNNEFPLEIKSILFLSVNLFFLSNEENIDDVIIEKKT